MTLSWRAALRKRAELLPKLKRLALPALITILLAAVACAYSVARIVAQAQPDLALSIMPSLAPALMTKSDALIAGNQRRERAKFVEARELAKRALVASPLDAPALRVIAATGPQNYAYARRLGETALRVSRRDLGTQLLLLELNVVRNDIRGVLRHYDQALKIRPSAGVTLYPILLSATDVPNVLPEVRRMVAAGPQWLPGMITWALDNPDHLRRVARLVTAFPAGSEALAPGYGQALVEALAERREYMAAFVVQRAYSRGSAVPGFAGGFTYPPIDWTVADNYETGSEFVEGPVPHVHFFAEPGREGVFLQRLTALRAGRYRLSFAVQKQANEARGVLGLTLSCQRSGEDRAFLTARVPLASGRFAQNFAVPQDCAFQWLRFSVASREGSVAADLTRIAIQGPA